MMFKSIFIDETVQKNFKVVFFKNKKFLVYTLSNSYLLIPKNIYIEKTKEKFLIWSPQKGSDNLLKIFSDFFSKFLINANKTVRKTLRLKGLGLKVLLFKNRKRLKLKLGFSHLIKIFIPNKIKLSRNKKKTAISFLSKDPVFLGNFCKIIKSFKNPNSYSGKGFSYNKEVLSLKTFKKK
jgi:ribosomal protein L6P/L9E